MTKRDRIYAKYNGLCAYSGTPLEPDWQIDHIEPVRRYQLRGQRRCDFPDRETEENLIPCQRLINNYKHSMTVEELRTWLLKKHLWIARLPKNPRTPQSVKRKESALKLAAYFGITPDTPFCGKFYFEQ